MVEEIVVKEALTKDLIRAGSELLQRLEKLPLKFDAVFWKYDAELNGWEFVIASPEVDTIGPKKIYNKIHNAFYLIPKDQRFFEFLDIAVVGTDDQLVSDLRAQAKAGYDLSGKRLKNTAINGHYIDDVYIYRVTP